MYLSLALNEANYFVRYLGIPAMYNSDKASGYLGGGGGGGGNYNDHECGVLKYTNTYGVPGDYNSGPVVRVT